MMTVTLCGSMRFEQEMRKIALELETCNGWNVLQCIYSDSERVLSLEEISQLAKAHLRKIQLSDAVYVVDIGGYLGESVRKEIAYAKDRGKTVLFHSQYAEKKDVP